MTRLPALDEAQRRKLAERLSFSPSDRSDDGSILPRTAAALAIDPSADGGAARLEALVSALALERVIVPVEVEAAVAVMPVGERAHAKHGDIDFVRTRSGAGKALVAYSSRQALEGHRPQDRPMAFDPTRLALVALVETGGRIVLDPGASEVLIPRVAVAALAQKDTWLPAWKDQELRDALRAAVRVGEDGIVDVRVSYGGEGCVRIELCADASAENGALRERVSRAARDIAAVKRLAAAADRVEICPRLCVIP